MKGWELIGEVGVDSGQLLLTDPCYIASEWQGEGDMSCLDSYFKDSEGRLFCYSRSGSIPEGATLFASYQKVLPGLGKTVNQLIKEGTLTEVKRRTLREYSYAGCCSVTRSDAGAGELHYKLGHSGAGVAFRSGYGDGSYPVYARMSADGRVAEVRVVMISPEEEADEFEVSTSGDDDDETAAVRYPEIVVRLQDFGPKFHPRYGVDVQLGGEHHPEVAVDDMSDDPYRLLNAALVRLQKFLYAQGSVEPPEEDEEAPAGYVVMGPEGIPLHPEPHENMDAAARAAFAFGARLGAQGYYFDCQQQQRPLDWVLERLSVVGYDREAAVKVAYADYVQRNLERLSEGWVPVCIAEFAESEEFLTS